MLKENKGQLSVILWNNLLSCTVNPDMEQSAVLLLHLSGALAHSRAKQRLIRPYVMWHSDQSMSCFRFS